MGQAVRHLGSEAHALVCCCHVSGFFNHLCTRTEHEGTDCGSGVTGYRWRGTHSTCQYRNLRYLQYEAREAESPGLIRWNALTWHRMRSLFLGLCECIWAIAGGVGPIIGGVFSQLLSWRWIFWVNLPFSGLAFLLLLLFLDVHNPRTNFQDGVRAVDWYGGLSILGLAVMLLLGLNFGGTTFPWGSPKVICLIVFGCLMSVVFVFSERHLARYPLMPLSILKHRSNVLCLVVGFMHGFVSIGNTLLRAPVLTQSGLHWW